MVSPSFRLVTAVHFVQPTANFNHGYADTEMRVREIEKRRTKRKQSQRQQNHESVETAA